MRKVKWASITNKKGIEIKRFVNAERPDSEKFFLIEWFDKDGEYFSSTIHNTFKEAQEHTFEASLVNYGYKFSVEYVELVE